VQGVGFRPFVYGLASRLHLGGFVRNQTGNVLIEIEGPEVGIRQFLDELKSHPPPLAKIETIRCSRQTARGDRHFEILPSEFDASATISICPDIATCDACRAEIFDPADRRYRYPFTNCTNCGPRLTIVLGAPYDRSRTTMAGFEMCADCRREYENPADRRFHAQPVACPKCGPSLRLADGAGKAVESADPLAAAVTALREGKILAIKGLGGFHLACDARSESAVRALRTRKHRDEKPFAVMVKDIATAEKYCHIDPPERALLTSHHRPIVLLAKKSTRDLCETIAPGNPRIGLMLPYTPLHHLLLHDLGDMPLVMTSGNRSDEPIAYLDEDALSRLGEIADLFLMHNRPIHVRCDDSVTSIIAGSPSPIRRSRGYAPQPITLPRESPQPILAVGGQLKSTFALARERQAILSHHLGDLDHLEAFRAFQRDIDLYQDLLAIRPQTIVHDLHPDYASTRYALQQRDQRGIECIAVQHHHAHIASCMAEHGLDEPVIGVSFDGTGYGLDGAVWGGEFLICDYETFQRVAHLRYVPLPGGDAAIREPWRIALSHLIDAGADTSPLEKRIDPAAVRTVRQMIQRKFNSPPTSSAGRLFDAIACIAGVRDSVSFEAQAAMQLEWLAAQSPPDGGYPIELTREGGTMVIDTRPLIRAAARDAADGRPPALIARRFHTAVVEMVLKTANEIRQSFNLNIVALSGGALMNRLLAEEISHRLVSSGFRVCRHTLVPPNDGGLSLGQLAVAIAHIYKDDKEQAHVSGNSR